VGLHYSKITGSLYERGEKIVNLGITFTKEHNYYTPKKREKSKVPIKV